MTEGKGDCWEAGSCSDEHPYCFFSCEKQEIRCCPDLPKHPVLCDGSMDFGCEVCGCSNVDFPVAVVAPNGDSYCCSSEYPWPCDLDGDGTWTCCSGPGHCE